MLLSQDAVRSSPRPTAASADTLSTVGTEPAPGSSHYQGSEPGSDVLGGTRKTRKKGNTRDCPA